MPAPILHLGATVLCSHAGQATPVAPFPARPAVGPAGGDADVAVCDRGLRAHRPRAVRLASRRSGWSARSRVMAGGAPVLTMTGQSVCVPTGTPMMPVVAQTRVLAT